ncbi:sugar phosphate isomerase/epimerase family protein [Cohnella fermenti]|uniref:Xylose isomerase-like TIM barrel domain-containing protein n=1 Tax=Cohnella fermenti TaxID=2565925 RepID=A0A4S4BKZ8_9BACL|nr:TIM barrel protein [Cohnella fermenti]THF75217.1 hypothetical protein E6C55_22370 [Cohnella fermenti]
MTIRLGVSLYSYQQTYLTGQLDLEGCIRTVVETTGATGIELIYEQMPLERYPDAVYPNITDKGISRWKELMDKYGTTPTCMDSFIDSKLYRGRISTVQEQIQMMEQDLKLASQLGFPCIRVLALVPPEVLEGALPAAEYYGVRMGQEVHPRFALNDEWMLNVAEISRRRNSKYVGLIPDFGIFSKGLPGSQLNLMKIMGENPDIVDFIEVSFKADFSHKEIAAQLRQMGAKEATVIAVERSAFMNRYNNPDLLKDLLDVIMHFHGKFTYMKEDCSEELTINYKDPIRILKEAGWDGYISSEFEGQRAYHGQNCPYEEDEIEQVRRHHVMLNRLLKS